MLLKILVPFFDKYTGKHYDAGDEKNFSEDRAKELLADERHLVEAVEIPFVEDQTKETEETPVEEEKPKKKATKKKK